MAVREHMFLAVAMFVISSIAGDFFRCYTLNGWPDNLGQSVLSRLSKNTLSLLEVLWPVQGLTLYGHRFHCKDAGDTSLYQINRMKATIWKKLVFYYFQSCEVFKLETESVLASRCMWGGSTAPTTASPPSILVVFCHRVSRVNLQSIQPDYCERSGVWKIPTEANGNEGAE